MPKAKELWQGLRQCGTGWSVENGLSWGNPLPRKLGGCRLMT